MQTHKNQRFGATAQHLILKDNNVKKRKEKPRSETDIFPNKWRLFEVIFQNSVKSPSHSFQFHELISASKAKHFDEDVAAQKDKKLFGFLAHTQRA